jgi:hypothetical protein
VKHFDLLEKAREKNSISDEHIFITDGNGLKLNTPGTVMATKAAKHDVRTSSERGKTVSLIWNVAMLKARLFIQM